MAKDGLNWNEGANGIAPQAGRRSLAEVVGVRMSHRQTVPHSLRLNPPPTNTAPT